MRRNLKCLGTKGNNLCDFLLFSENIKVFQKGRLLKKRLCFQRSKFSLLKADLNGRESKIKLADLLPLRMNSFIFTAHASSQSDLSSLFTFTVNLWRYHKKISV